MEKFSNHRVESGEKKPNREVLKVTKRVLQQLALWGVVTFNPLSTVDASAQDINNKDVAVSEKVLSFENRFKKEGLLELKVEKHKIPVVVVTTRKNIEANYSERGGFVKTHKTFTSEDLMVNFVNNEKILVVERSSDFVQSVINEAKLSEEGLVRPENGIKFGHWTPADYYVVSSTEKIGDHYVITNEIIDMVDGSTISVAVESADENSEVAISELAKKTEKAIEQHEANKKNEPDK